MGSENVNFTRYNFSFYWLTDLCFTVKSGLKVIFLEAGDEENLTYVCAK
jgi:hypothetical protein